MKPINDYLFIEKEPIKDTTEYGLYVGDLSKEGAATGTVYAVGPDVQGITVGAKVVFNEHQYDLLFKNKANGTDILVGKKAGIYAVHD